MAAPKGNQFWKIRAKHGRDKLFATPELLRQAAFEYFEWCDENPKYICEAIKSGDMAGAIIKIPVTRPYTISGLTLYLNTNESFWRNFKSIASEDFSAVINQVEAIVYTQKFEGAAIGEFNSNIIARDLGLREKTETDMNISGNPIQIVMPPDTDG